MNASDARPRSRPACEWRSDELGDSYVFQLTDAHLDELDAALVHAEATLRRRARHHPRVVPAADARRRARAASRASSSTGAGVVLIRGVPVERYGKERASSIYWGIGMHLGRPWPQNAKGHLLGDVTDQGQRRDRPDVARQRDRRHRVPVPLRRLRSRRPVLPRRRRERRREPRRQRR